LHLRALRIPFSAVDINGSSPPQASSGRRRVSQIFLWIAVAFALRTVALRGDGLWMDEGYTAWTAHLPAREHAIAVRHDDAPPLYYSLQRILLPHLPPNEASVRALSVAAGVAGTAWLAICLPFAEVGGLPAALFAAGTYGVYYGRQGRSYALLMLWALLLLTATGRFLRSGNPRWLVLVAASEGLALWTHNVAINLVIGANLAWIVCGRRHPRRWLIGQACVLAVWLPYLLTIFPAQYAVHSQLNTWIDKYWQKVPIAAAPLLSLASFTSGARVEPLPPAERWYYYGPGSTVISVLAIASVAILLAAALVRRGERRNALFAASFTLGPLLSLTILSIIAPPSYTPARTDAIAYGGFVLWIAIGLRSLPRRIGWPLLGILIVSTALAMAIRMPLDGHRREADRKIGERLRAEVRPGDWVAFVELSRPSIDYYLSGGRPGRPDPTIRRVPYPAVAGLNPASDHLVSSDSLKTWEAEAIRLRRTFESESGPPNRMFYFVGPMFFGRTQSPTAADLPYPGSILAYTFNGLRPLDPLARLPGDEMAVDWLTFRVARTDLIPADSLQPVQVEP